MTNDSIKTVSCALVLCVTIASLAYVAHDDGPTNIVFRPVYTPLYVGSEQALQSVIGPSLEEGVKAIDLNGTEGAFATCKGLIKFKSFDDFQDYVGTKGSGYNSGYEYEMRLDASSAAPSGMGGFDTGSLFSNAGGGEASVPVSSTNIQIAGVDEGDILKNDGEYAYWVSQDRTEVQIIRVHPAESAGILSTIECDGYVQEIYLHGARLVIIEQAYRFAESVSRNSYQQSSDPITMVQIFDVTNRSAPEFERSVRMSGQFTASRQIGDHLYIVGSYSLAGVDNESGLPVPADDIYRLDDEDVSYTLTQIMTMKINGEAPEPKLLSIVMGNSKTVLVTHQNLYITYVKTYSSGDLWSHQSTQKTVVHRLSIRGGNVEYGAKGEVTGSVLNKYSMDEHANHLRVATTVGWMEKNQMHVLDMDMNEVGTIDDIAPGERIYSCRFVGGKAYVVTFKKVDPLFVIDLSKPEAPKIRGQLKIPGYSDYLHPYDENHIIGVGKDTVDSTNGNFAWYQGVKISLFDVSDFENPVEEDKMVIGQRGSESLALSDPHAFLFDSERKLLILPMEVYPDTSQQYNYNGRWYGAYVFKISLETGITVAGKVSHNVEAEQEYDISYHDGYGNYAYNPVMRSFYIGDVIYTVSGRMLIGSSYPGFDEVCNIEFDVSQQRIYY